MSLVFAVSAPASTSTVLGPGPGAGTSTNNALALWNGTTGTAIKNSDLIYDQGTGILNHGVVSVIDFTAGALNDASSNISINFFSKRFYSNTGVRNFDFTDIPKSLYGNNTGANLGNLKTKITADAVASSTAMSGVDTDLRSFQIPVDTIRFQNGERIVFDFCGDSFGSPGAGAIIKVTFGGIQLGSNFSIANFDPWGAEGYIYFDTDSTNLRSFIKFYNGRDVRIYNTNLGINDPTPLANLTLTANDAGTCSVSNNFGCADWEGNNN